MNASLPAHSTPSAAAATAPATPADAAPATPPAAATVGDPLTLVRVALGALIGGHLVPVRVIAGVEHPAVVIDERFVFAATTVQRTVRTGIGMRVLTTVRSGPGWRLARLLSPPVQGFREMRQDQRRQCELRVDENPDAVLAVLIGELALRPR